MAVYLASDHGLVDRHHGIITTLESWKKIADLDHLGGHGLFSDFAPSGGI